MAKPVILYNSGKLEGLSGSVVGQVLTWNGTDWVAGVTPYDIASMVVGTPTATTVVMRLPAVRAYTISSTNTDHLFRAATAVTGVLTVKNAGSTVFTATFSASTTATISTPVNNTSVALGSDLTIEVTSTTDLADLYWNIKAVVA